MKKIAKKRVGRPRNPYKPDKVVTVSVTEQEREEYNELAEYHGKSLTQHIKDYLNRGVRKMKREKGLNR